MELVLGGIAIAVTCIAVVLVKLNKFGYDGSSNSATKLSLSLTWITSITDWIAFTLFALNYVSMGMASAERILEFAYPGEKEVESDSVKPSDQDLISKNWPADGSIEATNLICKYREGLPRVLKGLDFKINSHEKIGIVGRTGSGKSTLILNFKRILELDSLLPDEKKELPKIVINGVDISKIGLKLLR